MNYTENGKNIMPPETESPGNAIKPVLKKFRDIGEDPSLICDINFFTPEMQLLVDYIYSANIHNNSSMLDVIKKDLPAQGIYTPTEILLNPVNLVTKIEKKIKRDNSSQLIIEERNLTEMIGRTQAEILAIQEEGKENNRMYMEAPEKISSILEEMKIGNEASRKITEMISAIIMEIRSYKLDHSRVFITLEKIKEEHRSLTKEERINLGLDEILQKQKEIKSSTDNLLLRLNGIIKTSGNAEDLKDKISQLNYILKNTIEILPTIDYQNIKAYDKLKNNLERFLNERRNHLKRITASADGSVNINRTLKSLINVIYSEILWDKENKKVRITMNDLQRGPRKILTREKLRSKLSLTDSKFFSSFIDSLEPACRIVLMQNSGRSHFNSNLGIIVIHNYLLSEDYDYNDIARAFAEALLAFNPGILEIFNSHAVTKSILKSRDVPPEELFIEQYTACFIERFTYQVNGENHWASFCGDNRQLEFFTSIYFKSRGREKR